MRPVHAELPDLARRAAPLGALAVALGGVLVALGRLLTDVLDGSGFADEDLEVVRDLAGARSSGWDALTSGSTWLSNTLFVLAVLTVAVVVARRGTHGWLAPAFLVVAVVGEKAVYLAASVVVDRDRPPVPTTGFVHATSSFPSGHVGAALALYGAIAVLVVRSSRATTAAKVAAVAVAVLVPPLVAFARIYRGLHYPTDVLAGALSAAVWLTGSWFVLLRGRRRPAGRISGR
jgi:membrane-associated phospholipid phosphatase